MTYYYSDLEKGFFLEDFHKDIPEDSVELTKEKYEEVFSAMASGAVLSVVDGEVVATMPTPVPANVIVERRRKRAYSDPVTGSDRLFVEAQRMQFMGEEGWEDIKAQAIARYNEIKLENPWAEEE